MNTQERDGNGNMNVSGRPDPGGRGAAPKSSGSQAKKTPKKKPGKSFSKAIEKRRFEVGGIVIMVVAVMLLIAIFAYNPSDDATIENLSILDLFSDQGALAAKRLINPLGLIGAKI
ncbi:MAG: hypothetical protein HGB19_14220, partial [Chlorobiales bacterium]|nr:hypothetical protein [Chlorobiales bacterium]